MSQLCYSLNLPLWSPFGDKALAKGGEPLVLVRDLKKVEAFRGPVQILVHHVGRTDEDGIFLFFLPAEIGNGCLSTQRLSGHPSSQQPDHCAHG
jgi:hypothetical protein